MIDDKKKGAIDTKKEQLIQMTSAFCKEYLDEEYTALITKLIEAMSRKRHVPFLTGYMEVWAAAIIHAIGSINFLFDRSFKPYVSFDEICSYFKTSKSSVGQKSKTIRDMFKMGPWDKNFSTQHMLNNSPFKDLVVTEEGFIVHASALERLIKEQSPHLD